VDNHVLWIDPNDPRHLLSGNDGGRLRILRPGGHVGLQGQPADREVYKVTTDNAKPFYTVYIGTQDNNSLGGPSQTLNRAVHSRTQIGRFTEGGDGFQSQVRTWQDPNIVYSQAQFGAWSATKADRRALYLRGFEDSGKPAGTA